MGGGVPIFVKGVCIGGVGVSGVKPDEDEQVSTAGVQGWKETYVDSWGKLPFHSSL